MNTADLHQRALDRLAELRAQDARATTGPWKYPYQGFPGVVGSKHGCLWTSGAHRQGQGQINHEPDGTLIATMRNAWPAVLDLVQAALWHRPLTGDECGQGFPPDGGSYGLIDPSCAVCGTPGEYAERWPCPPFLRALAVLGIDPTEGEPHEKR